MIIYVSRLLRFLMHNQSIQDVLFFSVNESKKETFSYLRRW